VNCRETSPPFTAPLSQPRRAQTVSVWAGGALLKSQQSRPTEHLRACVWRQLLGFSGNTQRDRRRGGEISQTPKNGNKSGEGYATVVEPLCNYIRPKSTWCAIKAKQFSKAAGMLTTVTLNMFCKIVQVWADV